MTQNNFNQFQERLRVMTTFNDVKFTGAYGDSLRSEHSIYLTNVEAAFESLINELQV